MTDTPGAPISFVARPAASRSAASGGSSGSTSSRYSGSIPTAAASRARTGAADAPGPAPTRGLLPGLTARGVQRGRPGSIRRPPGRPAGGHLEAAAAPRQPPITRSVDTRPWRRTLALTARRRRRYLHRLGAGGTYLRIGLRAAAEERPRRSGRAPDVVIVLTDGGTPWPAAPPQVSRHRRDLRPRPERPAKDAAHARLRRNRQILGDTCRA